MTVRDAIFWIYGKRNYQVSDATLRNWIKKGVSGRKLKACRLGGQISISEKDLIEFFDHSGDGGEGGEVAPIPAMPKPSSDEDRIAAAEAELQSNGVPTATKQLRPGRPPGKRKQEATG